MDSRTLLLLLSQVVKLATPLLLAALGETLAESAGVIILALDGIIMLSALAAFATSFTSGNIVLGVVAGALVGVALAGIFAYLVVGQRRDPFATGLILGLLAIAVSAYVGAPFIGKVGTSMPDQPIPILADIPVVAAFANQNVFIYLSYGLVFVLAYYLYRTRPGITARAVGVNPEAALRRGIPVGRVQVLHILAAGLLAGLAGAAFSLDTKPGWTLNHTLGWGWLALTLVIFGRTNPVWVTVGTYLFTVLSAAGIIQMFIPFLPAQITGVVPYVLMLVVLLLSSGRTRSAKRQTA